MAPVISTPTAADIAKYPREFALWMQLGREGDGVVAQELADCISKYGGGGKVPASFTSGSVPFADIAALLQRDGTTAEEGSGDCLGYAAQSPTSGLKPWRFQRKPCAADDVRIQITHAGLCHSDVHQVRGEWGNSTYPMVPGHEIVGIVTEVGSGVSNFKVGDRAGVGCMVRSCHSCSACEAKEEQFCGKMVVTYNGVDYDGSPTHGGYSSHIVVNEKFVLRIPAALKLENAAPLLCAGITSYTPLMHFGLNKAGMRLGVVGLGGLGHMAVQFGKAMGLHVTVFSTSPAKEEEATKVLGADAFVVSKDADAMAAVAPLDGIIDTVAAPHELQPYTALLGYDGKLVLVGAPPCDMKVSPFELLFKRLTVAGSLIGGIERTQEMLDFCAEKGVNCMVEHISGDQLDTAYDRMVKADVRYRFVLDVQNSAVAGQA